MASSPLTSWRVDEETMETVRDCIFLGSKIAAGGNCNHEIKRHLLLGRKPMTNLLLLLLLSRFIPGILQTRTLEQVAISFSNA